MNTILIISLFVVCLGFMSFGYYVSRGKISRSAFLVSDRNINVYGITSSLTASCFGIWILIGPAEASTWGGVGAVIGYAAGQSFALLYFTGSKAFNTTMRSYALKLGLSLNEHGFYYKEKGS